MNKVKSFLKRWQSFSRLARSYSNLSSDPQPFQDDVHDWDDVTAQDFRERRPPSLVHADHDHKVDEPPEGSMAIYVGKSRRRYFISADCLNHPLLTVLVVEKFRDGFSVACEVVLFEHLVWILANSDPESIHSDSSLVELAGFYSCN
jgi:hypothetical protein